MTKTVKAIMDQKTRKLNSIKKLFNNILYSLGKSIFYMTFYFVENTFDTNFTAYYINTNIHTFTTQYIEYP